MTETEVEHAAAPAAAPAATTADPDEEATAREFIDYTEYLPSDIHRYLERIQNLNSAHVNAYDELDARLQEFSKVDSRLKSVRAGQGCTATRANGNPPQGDTQQAVETISDKEMELRYQISNYLNKTISTGAETSEEATRLVEILKRHHSRAVAIESKLDEVVLPSRDPTPEERRPRARALSDGDKRMRITLRLNADTPTSANRVRRPPATTASRGRPRLNPMPDSEEGWEDLPDTPVATQKIPKPRKKIPAASGHKRGPKLPPADPLMSGGTPARTPDGELIPNHLLPWNQLSNEELARLRKRMKKNSGWTPSVTMIVRELESLGRGPNNKDKFRDQWEGKEEVVVGPEDGGIGDPQKILPDDGPGSRENKGMRLNRAKKRKREEEKREREAGRNGLDFEEEERRTEAEEQERQRQQANLKRKRRREEEEAQRAHELLAAQRAVEQAREREAREREEEARKAAAEKAELERRLKEEAEARARAEAAAKEARAHAEKERLEKEQLAREKAIAEQAAKNAVAAAEAAAEAAAAAASAKVTPVVQEDDEDDDELSDVPEGDDEEERPGVPAPTLSSRNKRRSSVIPKPIIPTDKRSRAVSTVPPTPRPKRGSIAATPPPGSRKRSTSAASTKPKATQARKPMAATASARKRGQPGARRQKKDGTAGEDDDEEDTNKYCLCDEVSRGTMVACESDDCPKVWFHINCVGLAKEEAENEDLKWFCPICNEDGWDRRGGPKRRKR